MSKIPDGLRTQALAEMGAHYARVHNTSTLEPELVAGAFRDAVTTAQEMLSANPKRGPQYARRVLDNKGLSQDTIEQIMTALSS